LIGVEKIETSVNLKDKETINGVEYELFGVVNHFGSMTFGHYIAYVKKNDWVTYDDEKVKKCNVNGDNAYLLFYKRCN
jgi:ubiquitin C-terminal hydrolase